MTKTLSYDENGKLTREKDIYEGEVLCDIKIEYGEDGSMSSQSIKQRSRLDDPFIYLEYFYKDQY